MDRKKLIQLGPKLTEQIGAFDVAILWPVYFNAKKIGFVEHTRFGVGYQSVLLRDTDPTMQRHGHGSPTREDAAQALLNVYLNSLTN